MLRELASVARSGGCRSLWLATTNENVTAQRFYRALGWQEIAIHKGAIAESGRLKPEIPE
jgi:ribosomal protein S18 acetylase RimI-like enzyme